MNFKLLQISAVIVIGILAVATYTVFVHQELPASTTISPSPITHLAEQPKKSPPTIQEHASAIASISAQSYIIYDVDSATVIAERDADKRLMPASTTKIMTALIALSEYDPEEVITISRAAEAIGHVIDFTPGEQFRAGDMIKAMLINSGNDAAVSLADHHPLGYQTFVNLMNQKAISLGLKNTHFSNVSGVEADDHYSSVYDLSIMTIEAMKNSTFRDIVQTETATIRTIDSKKTHQLENLNRLLWDVPGVIGVKTGWTEIAGDCLVTYTSRDNHDIIAVVLKSKDRFADSTTLIEWAYQNILWQ